MNYYQTDEYRRLSQQGFAKHGRACWECGRAAVLMHLEQHSDGCAACIDGTGPTHCDFCRQEAIANMVPLCWGCHCHRQRQISEVGAEDWADYLRILDRVLGD